MTYGLKGRISNTTESNVKFIAINYSVVDVKQRIAVNSIKSIRAYRIRYAYRISFLHIKTGTGGVLWNVNRGDRASFIIIAVYSRVLETPV